MLAPEPTPLASPRLVLRPAAFLKLQYLCHAATTEVGGFGLSSADNPLVIEDVLLVRQQTTVVTVEFDDESVADHIDALADAGVPPQRCSRVWVHTHPGTSATPSMTDERTFARSFGGADFSVMLILARGGAWYARLQLIGPVKTAIEIPVVIDWASLPQWLERSGESLPAITDRWRLELAELVHPVPLTGIWGGRHAAADDSLDASFEDPGEHEWQFYEPLNLDDLLQGDLEEVRDDR